MYIGSCLPVGIYEKAFPTDLLCEERLELATKAGYDPVCQLRLAKGYLVGVHVKDATPGVVRGVPFETGIVPFENVFKTLEEMSFWGPLAVEMWADRDANGDPFKAAVQARKLVDRLVGAAWGSAE